MAIKNNEAKDLVEADTIVEQVEKLPKEERQVVLQQLEIYQGDLPHPDILKGYNELYPDAAKKIIDNGIAESVHRRQMEERYLKGNIISYRFGQWFGFIVALSIILGGIYLISTDHPITGTLLTGTTAIGIIGLFTGNSQEK